MNRSEKLNKDPNSTILIVDDCPDDRFLLAASLDARCRILEAADGFEALSLVRSEHPDLVVSDVLLPKMDGYELVRQIRADPSTAPTKVVFYTGLFEEEDARALASDLGVDHLVIKSANVEPILDLIADELAAGSAESIPILSDQFDFRHKQLLTDKLKEQNTAVRTVEERFRALVQASSDLIFRLSPDWREMRQFRGRNFTSGTETPNNTWLDDFVHPDDRETVLAAINGATRRESVFEMEHRVLNADGSIGWMFTRAIPLRENGEIIEWFGAASDITERKRMEEDLRKSRDELALHIRELDDKSKNLEEVNIALKVLLKQREADQKGFCRNDSC